MKSPQLAQAGRQLRTGWLTIILIATSIGSSLAAIAGLKLWVTVPVAVAAVASGLRLVFVELVVPFRSKAAWMATAQLCGRSHQHNIDGTALHIGQRRWVTSAHVVDGFSDGLTLFSDRQDLMGRVVEIDRSNDLAVIVADTDWPWRARLARSLPDPGVKLNIFGWAAEWSRSSSVRSTLSVVLQGTTADGRFITTGPLPPGGFSGAPAMDTSNGRVIGLVLTRRFGEFEHLGELRIIPASALRSARHQGVLLRP